MLLTFVLHHIVRSPYRNLSGPGAQDLSGGFGTHLACLGQAPLPDLPWAIARGRPNPPCCRLPCQAPGRLAGASARPASQPGQALSARLVRCPCPVPASRSIIALLISPTLIIANQPVTVNHHHHHPSPIAYPSPSSPPARPIAHITSSCPSQVRDTGSTPDSINNQRFNQWFKFNRQR